MKRLIFALTVLTFAFTSLKAQAQEPSGKQMDLRRGGASITVSGTLTPTPEMWLYEQERLRHEDPYLYRLTVAQKKAAQRRARIAARNWYGISGTRPAAMGNKWYDHSMYNWGQNSRKRSLWTDIQRY